MFYQKECVADANDESFKLLIKKWMGRVDELPSIQNDCFDNIVSKNLLSIQTQKVPRSIRILINGI